MNDLDEVLAEKSAVIETLQHRIDLLVVDATASQMLIAELAKRELHRRKEYDSAFV